MEDQAYFSPIFNTNRRGRDGDAEALTNRKISSSSKCCMAAKVCISQQTSSQRAILIIILLFSLVCICVGSEVILRYWEKQSRKYLHEGECQSFNCSVAINVAKLKEECCCDVLFLSPQEQQDELFLSPQQQQQQQEEVILEPSPGVIWNDTPHRICGSDNGIKMDHCKSRSTQPQFPCWYDIIDRIVWREYPSGRVFRIIIIVCLVLITPLVIGLILKGCKSVPIKHLSFDAQAYLRHERFEKLFTGDDDDDNDALISYQYMNTVSTGEVSVASINSSDAEYAFPDGDDNEEYTATIGRVFGKPIMNVSEKEVQYDIEDDGPVSKLLYEKGSISYEEEEGDEESNISTGQQHKLGYNEHEYGTLHPVTMLCESPPSEGDD